MGGILVSTSPWGRLIGRLVSRRGLAIQASTALVAGALLAAASPASATTAPSELSAYTALDGTKPNGSYTTPPPNGKVGQKDGTNGYPKDKKHHKKHKNADGFGGCIDSSQQSNEKFLVYVPERDSLWVWKENRGQGSVNPWVQFTETGANNTGEPIPEGVVCATIVNKGSTVAITIVTQNNSDQQVWQTECSTDPDNANNPFDPNERCDEFEELTPLPVDMVTGTESNTEAKNSSSNGPSTGDGATAAATGVPGVAAMAGGALLGLALTVALRRRRTNSA
jgi:hypothetical protein